VRHEGETAILMKRGSGYVIKQDQDPWKEYRASDRPITLTPKSGRIVKELFV